MENQRSHNETIVLDDHRDFAREYCRRVLRSPPSRISEFARYSLREIWGLTHSGYYADVQDGVRKFFAAMSNIFAGSLNSPAISKFVSDRSLILSGSHGCRIIPLEVPWMHSASTSNYNKTSWPVGSDARSATGLPVSAVEARAFTESCMNPSLPLIIRGGCKHWEALYHWCSSSFWKDMFRQCYVPIEIGVYQSPDFRQAIVTLEELVAWIGVSSGEDDILPYLAQYDLLRQFPILCHDAPEILLPTLPAKISARYIFFGPGGTVTPFHSDPYSNLFCQAVGAKYFKLAPPSSGCPRNPCINTVVHSEPDSITSTNMYDAMLLPGDVLYIPKYWWHYVQSLGNSISVATFLEGD
jgi:hypothetical protein